MILQKEFHVIYALAHVCGQDRTLLASLLLRIFRHEKAEAPLLRTLNDREINMEGKKQTQQTTNWVIRNLCCKEKKSFVNYQPNLYNHMRIICLINSACALLPDEATTLFRATTLASTLMEQYMKATATPFVHHALKDTILKIMESKQSCEVKTCKGFRLSHTALHYLHVIVLYLTLSYAFTHVFTCITTYDKININITCDVFSISCCNYNIR